MRERLDQRLFSLFLSLGDWLIRRAGDYVPLIPVAIFLVAFGLSCMVGSRGIAFFTLIMGFNVALLTFVAPLVAWFLRWKTQFIARQSFDLQSIRQMYWKDFENLAGELLTADGYQVEHRGGAQPDGGVDLIAWKDGQKKIVQCKHFQFEDVGEPIIRDLCGTLRANNAQGGIVVTSGDFTPQARLFAEKEPIELIDGVRLFEMFQKFREQHKGETPDGASANPSLLTRAVMRVESFPGGGTIPPCPECGVPMILKRRQRDQTYFWSCSRYPKCRGGNNLSPRDNFIAEHVRRDFSRKQFTAPTQTP